MNKYLESDVEWVQRMTTESMLAALDSISNEKVEWIDLNWKAPDGAWIPYKETAIFSCGEWENIGVLRTETLVLTRWKKNYKVHMECHVNDEEFGEAYIRHYTTKLGEFPITENHPVKTALKMAISDHRYLVEKYIATKGAS